MKKTKIMKKKVLYFLASALVLALAVGLTSFFMKNQEEPRRSMKNENLLSVKVDTVSTRKLHPSVEYEGRISSYETVALAAEVTGRIMKGEVPFKEGENFQKGDLLVKIYKEDAQAAMTSGKSNFLRTLSSILPDLKVDFPNEYKKWKDYFNKIDVHKELPALPQIDSEKEQVFMASQGVLPEYYNLHQQEIRLKKYNLYAPFDGAFQRVNKQVGAIASPGAALATIVRTDKLEVIVPVPPEDARWISPGDKVKLTGNRGITKNGKVTRVADFLDPSTQSVNIYVEYIPSGPRSFKVGEFVKANFKISRTVSGFKIPREAVMDNEEVYTVKDNRLRKRSVKVIRKLQDHAVISGLENGTLIVSESLVDVSEGQKVEIR
jgi:multidrug efflux pump subunit AcrA (membrane-fusion protein)